MHRMRRWWSFGLGAGALLMAFSAMAAEVPKFEVDPFWPKPLPNNWTLGQVAGVAVDERDHVWIMQRPRSLSRLEAAAGQKPPRARCCVAAPPVIEFDPDGNVVQAWGEEGAGYEWPKQEHGIRVDKDFVWFGGNHKDDGFLLKFTRDGKFVQQIGKPGPRKGDNDTTQLGQPADFWIDAGANELYVADGYGNHRVIVFDAATGAYKRHWGAYGKRPADEVNPTSTDPGGHPYDPNAPLSQTFNNPVHCVKIANDGLVYVCDRTNDRLQVFRKDGSFVQEQFIAKDTFGSGSVWDIGFSVDPQQQFAFVVDGTNQQVYVLDRKSLNVLSTFGGAGHWAGQFYGAHNLAVNSKGDLFITETYEGKRVQKFVQVGTRNPD